MTSTASVPLLHTHHVITADVKYILFLLAQTPPGDIFSDFPELCWEVSAVRQVRKSDWLSPKPHSQTCWDTAKLITFPEDTCTPHLRRSLQSLKWPLKGESGKLQVRQENNSWGSPRVPVLQVILVHLFQNRPENEQQLSEHLGGALHG